MWHTEPKTLPEFVEADLRRAARLILMVQDEIDPQFRFSTPSGADTASLKYRKLPSVKWGLPGSVVFTVWLSSKATVGSTRSPAA